MPDYSTDIVRPQSPEELAEAMGWASARHQTIELGGHFSKRLMGGPAAPSNITISTAAMRRVRQYEPRDLTIRVEAGISYCDLNRLLAEQHQMIPLDPSFAETATIGGIVACNCSGPRRRLYGTARDMVIGIEFATLEGKLVESGGMGVKNVAGLDMSKLMIGSFGTLAAIAVVNFKLIPQPPCERTFRFSFAGLEKAVAARDAILKSPLDPAAIDLLNPAAAEVRVPGRPSRAGTPRDSMPPILTIRGPRMRSRRGSCTTWRGSIRRFSGSARARRWRWTRSSGWCLRAAGRPSSRRASTRRRCAAARPGYSSAGLCLSTGRPWRAARRKGTC